MRSSSVSFLEELGGELFSQHRDRCRELTLIFPNLLAVRAFKQCWIVRFPKSTLPTSVLSADTLLQQLSPLRQAPPLLLIHTLYEVLQSLQPQTTSHESFEQFYSWGSHLLADFDVVDKYLVDATHLFKDLSQYKAFELSHDYLTEAQQGVIQSFWKNFKQRLSAHQQSFLRLWQLLPQVYQRFRQRLETQGIGYSGLCYRVAYENLVKGDISLQHTHMVFAGFNALTPVEERIMVWCQTHLPTAFYWDLDAYYMDDIRQEAGLYLRAYQRSPTFQNSFRKPFPKRLVAGNQAIYITEVASEVGQVQVMRDQIKILIDQLGRDFVPGNMVVVVANESLYTPVLRTLRSIEGLPITTNLGYLLQDTLAYRLLVAFFMLYSVTTQQHPAKYFAVSHVMRVLHHPFVMAWHPEQVQNTLNQLQASKQRYIAPTILTQENPFYAIIFRALRPQDRLLDCLTESIKCVHNHVEIDAIGVSSIEKIALIQLVQRLVGLQNLLVRPSTNHEALLQLLRQLVQNVRLPLPDTQPEHGVQVLDILATQNLDFDYVFILGMNEGHFPVHSSTVSFIPYNLRRGYGLPTADQHQAALYAYHFYRLLQRAKQVHITYSAQTVVGNPVEKSRYLWQLAYEANLCTQNRVATQPIFLVKAQPITILKQGAVLQQVKKLILQPNRVVRSLNPSALNTYLDCRLRFYFHFFAKLEVPKPPPQATNSLVFGSLLHMIMEKLYTPLVYRQRKQPLSFQDLEVLRKQIVPVVKHVFLHMLAPQQSHGVGLPGDYIIAQDVMTKLVDRILVLDQSYAPFFLIGIEMGRQVPFHIDFSLDTTLHVRLQGVIDRLDWKAGVFRVLDYKTGLDGNKINSITTLFDRTAIRRNRAAFQAFFYAWLFQQQGRSHILPTALPVDDSTSYAGEARSVPGLLNTRKLFSDHFDPRLFLQQPGSRHRLPIEDVADHQEEWEQGLSRTLSELLDPTIPFSQTDDVAQCTFCPYKGICQRN